MTNAQYGGSFILENPANGSLSYHEVYNDTYKGFNYSYDAIGNLETLSRYGFLGGPNCDAGYLDFATVRLYDCAPLRLYESCAQKIG
ncbi:MAG: hypothetical protein JNK77_01415 [Saprospiraceae bacterium]|nr:hypothetical protein [Saprospiraceae bacterium]